MIKDYSKVTVKVTVLNGVREEKTERSYRREVALKFGDDPRIPEQFMGEWGNKPTLGHLELVRLQFWFRPDYRQDNALAWDLIDVRVNGPGIKANGSVGERQVGRRYFDGAGPDNLPQYAPPAWLQEIIEEMRPTGEVHPYAIDIIAEHVEEDLVFELSTVDDS